MNNKILVIILVLVVGIIFVSVLVTGVIPTYAWQPTYECPMTCSDALNIEWGWKGECGNVYDEWMQASSTYGCSYLYGDGKGFIPMLCQCGICEGTFDDGRYSCTGYTTCGNGVCEPAIGENTNNCPEDCEDAEETTCDGCLYNNQCVTYGYRVGGYYCDLSKEFKEQKSANTACENNHECISNLCAANKCVSASAWQRFLNWFSRIFGGAAVGIPK